MSSKFWTGVGSRDTPLNILETMTKLASDLEDLGFVLRSGAAPGADAAFERGVKDEHNKHIYLPWKGFERHASSRVVSSPEAFNVAMKVHPRWNALTQGGKRLHARNVHQVLGDDLRTPSKFLVCWTRNGEEVGGTRTAIVLAKSHSVPVFNLWNQDPYFILEHARNLVKKDV